MAQEVTAIPTVPDDALTPREMRLNRATDVFRWGAIASGVVAALVLLAGIAAGLQSSPDFFASLQNLLLGRFPAAADVAVFTAWLLTAANVAALLLLVVGALAQEVWALAFAWLLVAANIGLLALWGFSPAVVAIIPAVAGGFIMSRDVGAFRLNPVMLKELRGRMRGMRAFVVMTIYLALMSAVTVLIYLIDTPLNRGSSAAVTGDLGRTLFAGVVGIELLLIIFIAPAFTAGAITGERERKTYDLLQTTLLPNPSFIVGKLESSLSYILLLLLAAIPLQSIAFLFGGVTELELIMAFVILVVTAIALGTIGLYFSASADKTLTASVRSYTVALIITFGVPLIMSLFLNFYGNALTGVGTGISSSPVLETILIYLGLLLASLNPIATALFTQNMLIDHRQLGFLNLTLSSNGSQIPVVSPWISFTIIYLITSAILVLLAVRRMRKTEA